MVPVSLSPPEPATEPDVGALTTLAWALTSATVLGYVEAAVDLAVAHARERRQFGQRIGDFQAVQFQITDAVTAAAGLAELTQFTAWRITSVGADAYADALALRVHAADVARTAMRTAQQLHGASGVAEEYDVSVLCRRVQAPLRSPASSERVLDALSATVRAHGFASLFPHGTQRS
jgi:alkylation response protein AidB-like acyl-CoA dehydrogenase